jgi:cell division GTPase FtsZ
MIEAMSKLPDPALDAMTAIIKGWVDMMQHGRWPAVDFADMRAVLTDGGRAIHGMGEVTRPERAIDATKLAVSDLDRQLKE